MLRIRRANDNQLKHAPADNNTAWWWEWLQSVPILNFDMKPRYPQPCDQHTMIQNKTLGQQTHAQALWRSTATNCERAIGNKDGGVISAATSAGLAPTSDYLTCCRCLLRRRPLCLFGLYACSAITIRLGSCRRLLGLCRCRLLHTRTYKQTCMRTIKQSGAHSWQCVNTPDRVEHIVVI